MASLTKSPTTIISDDSIVGNYAWLDPGNVAASDDVYATANGGGSSMINSQNYVRLVVDDDYEESGPYQPANTNFDTLPTAEASENFGGASDKWQWTPVLAKIKAADFGCIYSADSDALGNGPSAVLKCTGFDFSAIPDGSTIDGFVMSVEKKRIGGVAHVDAISLTVHYTEADNGNRRRRLILGAS